MKVKNYGFEFEGIGISEYNLAAYLEDTYLNTSIPLKMEGTTNHTFNIKNVPGSYAANRFRIVFKKVFSCNTINATMQNDDVAVNWQVTGEENIHHYEVERSTDGNSFTKIATAAAMGNNKATNDYIQLDEKPAPGIYYYRIKAISKAGAIGYSKIVQVKMMNTKGALYVFPNPVTNGTIGLQLNTQPAGNYAVRLINVAGQTMLTKTIPHAGGTASVAIPYPIALKGSYQLEVTAPGKKVRVVKIILE